MQLSDRKLLFIEDDLALAEEIRKYFSEKNTVMIANNVRRADECIRLLKFDAIVTDIILPDGSGLDIFEKYEKLPPVIVLSNLGSDDNILEGLYYGAIDYIVKPCSLKVLEAKLILRLAPQAKAEISANGLVLNRATRKVNYLGKPIQLTSSEFNILHYLMSHPGTFFSSNELYEKIWLAQSLNTTTIRKHISSMRRKLLDATEGKEFILTDFGKGYAFSEAPDEN